MPNRRSPTIIVLYDPHCTERHAELLTLKAKDQLNQLKLINIRDAQFSAHAWGFAPEALVATLHVRDLAGYWHTDTDAIHLLYRAVDLTPPLFVQVRPLTFADAYIEGDNLAGRNYPLCGTYIRNFQVMRSFS